MDIAKTHYIAPIFFKNFWGDTPTPFRAVSHDWTQLAQLNYFVHR